MLIWKAPKVSESKTQNQSELGNKKAFTVKKKHKIIPKQAKKKLYTGNTLKPKDFGDAVVQGDMEKVTAMIKTKPELIFGKNKKYGRTPLAFAVQENHKDMVELLLAHGADGNAKDSEGNTPLHEAAFSGHLDMAKLLLANNADVNATNYAYYDKNEEGDMPLHFAALRGHKDMVELLLANGAMIDFIGNDGSPLHNAAENGNSEVAELLLANGAEVNNTNIYCCTPLNLAIQNGHKDVVELLLKHGGHENKF